MGELGEGAAEGVAGAGGVDDRADGAVFGLDRAGAEEDAAGEQAAEQGGA